MKYTKTISLILAILLTITIGYSVPLLIDNFNDETFGHITLLDKPLLLQELKNSQDKGTLMAIHGWRHENFSDLTFDQARDNIYKAIEVFKKANLVPVAFLSPYMPFIEEVSPPGREGIQSTGIPTALPILETNGFIYYYVESDIRYAESFDDPRYEVPRIQLEEQQPTYILLHAQDWNPYLKQLMFNYLQETNQFNITVRVDDPEVNTPPEVISEMTEMLKFDSVGQLAFAVIPSGTWTGGTPTFFNLSVNTIMGSYWLFFLGFSFFPSTFFLFWRSILSRTKNGKPKNESESNELFRKKPSVSIIVPGYNEEKNIGNCIESILKQNFKGELETIIINDGSTDKTAEIASMYPVKLINLDTNQGKSSALNLGIKESKGDIIIFSDSDSQIDSNAVDSLVECLERRSDIDVVAGNVLINDTDGKHSFLKYLQMIEYRTEQHIGRFVQSTNGQVIVCPGPLFAVRRKVAEDVMFSDKTIIEDADFTVEALKKSYKITQDIKAKVYTQAPKSLKSWYKQRKRWWYGNLQLWRTHKQWAKKNPWMLMNYLGFIISLFSLALLFMLPYFFSTYESYSWVLMRGIGYAIAPVILFTIFTAVLFTKEKKLILMLPFYTIFYSTLKTFIVSYLYIRYLMGRGISVVFGAKIIKVK